MISQTKIALLLSLCIPLSTFAKEYNEQSLKTLFTNQQQRQDIENTRGLSDTPGQAVVTGPSSVHVHGMVKRSNGENIVWVNGSNTLNSTNVGGVKVYSNSINSKNKIPIVVDGVTIYLKPGETWSEETGVSGVGD